MRDMLDRQEACIERKDLFLSNLRRGQQREIPNARRKGRREPRVENCDEYIGSDIDKTLIKGY